MECCSGCADGVGDWQDIIEWVSRARRWSYADKGCSGRWRGEGVPVVRHGDGVERHVRGPAALRPAVHIPQEGVQFVQQRAPAMEVPGNVHVAAHNDVLCQARRIRKVGTRGEGCLRLVAKHAFGDWGEGVRNPKVCAPKMAQINCAFIILKSGCTKGKGVQGRDA